MLMVAGAIVAPAAAEGFSCVITAPRPARAFFPHEPIYLTITATGPRQPVGYVIYDYEGRRRIVDTIILGDDQPALLRVPFDMPLGIYYLTLTFPGGPQVQDAFCVIPRPDDQPGDYGIFSFHCGDQRGPVLAALAQIGVRIIRNDMDWVNSEPAEGQYSLAKAQRLATLYKKYGMQWIPILGYTPGWMGMKPENAQGRPSYAAHCWPPRETTHWAGYVKLVVDYLSSQRVHWPSEKIIARQDAYASDDLPLVSRWEIWNEVDQNFYYGYWHRYLDLLRIAYCTAKQADERTPVVYGGSCGHWTELGMTYHANCKYYFDELAFHPGGTDIGRSLEVYYTGAPQIGNGYGIYHPAVHTETHPTAPKGLTPAQNMYRLYTTLKKWNERIFCTFHGGRLIGPADPASGALLWEKRGQLVPNAKYVAFAVARWVLSNATYVGPLNFGEGIEAALFLKNGRPMLVAWAGQDTTISIDLADDARIIDEMGRKFPPPGTGLTRAITLTARPTVIYGLHYPYFTKALRNQAEIYLTTPQGFKTDRDFGYIGPLQKDAAWVWAQWPGHFRRTLASVIEIADRQPRAGPRMLGVAQMVVHGQLYRTLRQCADQGKLAGPARNLVHRLQTVSEWLGQVADARDECWDIYAPRSSLIDELSQRINDLNSNIRSHGMIYPLAWQSLQRAQRQLGEAVKENQAGAYRAAVGAINTAALLAQVEPPVLTDVFAVANFPTATQLVKTLTLIPGQQHNLQVRVYNFTDQSVSGSITWELPETWDPHQITKSFSVPAYGYSEPLDCRVTIPGEPRPWVKKDMWTPCGTVPVHLPKPLAQRSDLCLKGQLGDGRTLLTMHYEVGVGEWVPPSSDSQATAEHQVISLSSSPGTID